MSLGESSGSHSLQTDSLAESWATVSIMDEDVKGLDTTETIQMAEERSENHSTISDIVQLEREEVELLEQEELLEEAELQSSTMSVLGIDRELTEMGEELYTQATSQVEIDLRPPETVELLMSMEEPLVVEVVEEVVQPTVTITPPVSEPSVSDSVPIPAVVSEARERLQLEQKLSHPPEVDTSLPAEGNQKSLQTKSIPVSMAAQEAPAPSAEEAVSKAKSKPPAKVRSFELPVMLCGSAALVAVVGMVTYTLIKK
ncbi:bcl-2-like protein 13 [Chanos chanos]|uniref:Bcl-2-like protein 13 n=1 Tax=Chanos chanos TaxID=29144 RepID=A0A6J2VT25_CHACN|nr:bcl-2-like protein 13 [Chanos chanos]